MGMDAPAKACAEWLRCVDGQLACGETLAVEIDCQRAIEALMEFDPGLSIAAPAGSG